MEREKKCSEGEIENGERMQRRFRVKIQPDSNSVAEEELRREIRCVCVCVCV